MNDDDGNGEGKEGPHNAGRQRFVVSSVFFINACRSPVELIIALVPVGWCPSSMFVLVQSYNVPLVQCQEMRVFTSLI